MPKFSHWFFAQKFNRCESGPRITTKIVHKHIYFSEIGSTGWCSLSNSMHVNRVGQVHWSNTYFSKNLWLNLYVLQFQIQPSFNDWDELQWPCLVELSTLHKMPSETHRSCRGRLMRHEGEMKSKQSIRAPWNVRFHLSQQWFLLSEVSSMSHLSLWRSCIPKWLQVQLEIMRKKKLALIKMLWHHHPGHIIGFSQVITWLDLLHFAIKLSANYIIFSGNYDIVGGYASHQQHREFKMRENLHLLETVVFLPPWQVPTVLSQNDRVECSCRFLSFMFLSI